MDYIIYKLTNKINNKFYIGITSETLNHRWKGHCRKARFGSTSNLHQAIRKYGEENWSKEILFEFKTTDKKYAYSVEQEFINKYNAYEDGYNMDIGFGWNIVDRSGKNNPMYGKVSGNASKVVVNGNLYNSVSEAGKVLNKNRNTIARWCRSEKEKYKDCYYV
jgi:group I intron endonuclease